MAVAGLARATSAEARPAGERVALVRPAAAEQVWPEVEQRTRAELQAAGFEVVTVVLDSTADLEGISATARALAAVQITRGGPGRGVTVHVVDRVTGKSSSRTLDAGATPEPERIALRAVELLYASLLELEARNAPSGQVPATALVTKVARERLLTRAESPKAAFRTALLGLTSTGGVGTLLGVEVSGVGYVVPWLGVSVAVGATAPTQRREGSASAWFALGLARLGVAFEPWPRARLSPALEARAGLLFALADGSSDAGAPTTLDLGASPFVAGSLSLGSYVRRDLRLRAATELGSAFEPLTLRFAGARVASFGQPWLGVSLGVEWLY